MYTLDAQQTFHHKEDQETADRIAEHSPTVCKNNQILAFSTNEATNSSVR
jgi:hypothetical protein